MTVETFQRLFRRRWQDVCDAFGIDAARVPLYVDFGPYPHFKKKRGYAVAISNGDGTYHIRFAPKTLQAPEHRADGLMRHELGHLVDYLVPKDDLNRICAEYYGVQLPKTAERRADTIALAVWGEPLRYDADLVQSTRHGVTPRPRHLGL
jgi:hypothetical protein